MRVNHEFWCHVCMCCVTELKIEEGGEIVCGDCLGPLEKFPFKDKSIDAQELNVKPSKDYKPCTHRYLACHTRVSHCLEDNGDNCPRRR